jgi:hypothetical protein
MKTKMVLTVLGLATLVATPAFAQKPMHRAVNDPAVNGPYASVAQPAPIVTNGYYVGTDPDASVRFELNRDAPTYSVGN